MSNNKAPNRDETKTNDTVRSFSEDYRQSMDKITLSPELRERILQMEKSKRTPSWLRAVKPVAAVAACFVVLFAAHNLSGVNLSALSTAEAPATGAAAVNETAAYPAAKEAAPASLSSADTGADTEEDAPAETEGADNGVAAYSLSPDEAVPDETAPDDAQQNAPIPRGDNALTGNSAPAHIPPSVLGESIPSEPASEESVESSAENSADNSAESSADGSAEDPSESYSSANNNMIVNPMVGYETLSDAEAVLGWSVKAPPLETASLYLINGSMFEADWADGSCYRMAETALWGDDISGDYNSYAYEEAETISDMTVFLSGENENSLILLIWSDGTYSYSYYSALPMTNKQTRDFLTDQLLSHHS